LFNFAANCAHVVGDSGGSGFARIAARSLPAAAARPARLAGLGSFTRGCAESEKYPLGIYPPVTLPAESSTASVVGVSTHGLIPRHELAGT
jgi:hypothetical protein